MKYWQLHIVILLLLPLLAVAQISPGPLIQGHAELEGMGNCTQCHDLGNKVSNAKCLACHEEIQTLMDQNRGYHASREVRRKDCFVCHSDHHGRNFNATRFDEDNFNHSLTGYELEGQHNVIDCRECHQAEYISDREIRQREGTFLGLDDACLSCHDDYHQGTLENDCTQCHNIEAFAPAPFFDHDDTDYPLKGRHVNVDCLECHEKGTRAGKDFQFFSGIEFNDCIACHEDPHGGNIAGTCNQCHEESSWKAFTGQTGFNHNRRTNFELRGQHQNLECIECHAYDPNPLTVFQDLMGIAADNCVACHEDVHDDKFGTDCVKCHQEASWTSLRSMDFFDHNQTDYPLEGMHVGVDCQSCHAERFLDPIDFSQCQNCHEDYHMSEFVDNGVSPDCAECHSLFEGFAYSLYTLEQHQASNFPLEGAHIATPCFACHIDEEEDRWTFRDIGTYCIDCHDNTHEGYISTAYYPDNDCTACHNSDSWLSIAFDHDQTNYPLVGAHADISCGACHYPTAEDGSTSQIFQGLEQDCTACHDNVHGDQFAVAGVTDCTRCHDTFTWYPNEFDHDLTDFPLEGAHAAVDCKACHIPEFVDGKLVTNFKIERFECIDCHQ